MKSLWAFITLSFALAGCGQNEGKKLNGKLGIFSIHPSHGQVAAPANNFDGDSVDEPSYQCTGTGKSEPFRLQLFGQVKAFTRVVLSWVPPLESSEEVLGDYRSFTDVTPPPPTDISSRVIFASADTEGLVVTLTTGGFTQGTTASVIRQDGSEAERIASLVCVRK